jgi:Uma2 family endonuclease
MKAVILEVDPSFLERRKRLGHDRWDEMWEGVLHMPAMPILDHQDFEGDLEVYLKLRWARPIKAKVFHQVNVALPGGWPDDFRIPDLALVTRDRFHIFRLTHLEGPPNVAIEIHSPGDEAYEKLLFYLQLGVFEVWIIHRDTKKPEIYLADNGQYVLVEPDAEGWVRSPTTGLEMRSTLARKLSIRLAGQEATREDLPVD